MDPEGDEQLAYYTRQMVKGSDTRSERKGISALLCIVLNPSPINTPLGAQMRGTGSGWGTPLYPWGKCCQRIKGLTLLILRSAAPVQARWEG